MVEFSGYTLELGVSRTSTSGFMMRSYPSRSEWPCRRWMRCKSSEVDYNKWLRKHGGPSTLQSSPIDRSDTYVFIKGVKHKIYKEECPMLKKARIWHQTPSGWNNGWVDEKADLGDKILYRYPDYPLTGRPTGIEISFAGWGVRMLFSEPTGDALFGPDLESREYTCEMDNNFKKIGTTLML